ncbi:hypothetical protein ACM41_24340 [Bradyrhizobium sp. CCBAU 21362]|uniref:hypothetical protein n=1 Tax=Bradyrhizobium sp. CCBAU 21362 TaxID=1325082 RepID=UPI002304ECCF|nr:hypothetical protein [Bradyrhizobium sp. CCBAU 21362]MDA9539233.1 hypothetical protein [Bradyrhizobium sp. CCBAU 21362]
MTEHTKDKLAAALRDVGLTDMADKAATGYYHDYLSPLDMPELELIRDLARAASMAEGRRGQDDAKKILELRRRAMNGDFDASEAESEEWAKSEEGQAAFRMLTKGGKA